MKMIKINDLEKWYSTTFQNKISGRRIVLKQILPLINELNSLFQVDKIGLSHLKNEIYRIQTGDGKIKIMIWTQMHGNESTGTKAFFDLIEFFKNAKDLHDFRDVILKNCTIICIPILNPDGAENYTRVNAQGIDLNRDVIDKKAIESCVLREVLDKVKPDYCFNMHDQRTIFSVGKDKNPATLSFLAPSEEIHRRLTNGRKETMKVIVSMFQLLQKCIPMQIGRYTDEFYPTATGDNFQKMGYNTVLIESGHFKDDYQREITRKYTFYALLQGLIFIAYNNKNKNYKLYFDIPNNKMNYLDIIIKNVKFQGVKMDLGILFKEKMQGETIFFKPILDKIEDLSEFNANKIIDCPHLVFQKREEVEEWLKNKKF